MTERFHKFRAASLDEAYKAMRRKLGERAVVLQTETVSDKGLGGFLGRQLIEITAAIPEAAGPRKLTSAEKKYAQAMLGALAMNAAQNDESPAAKATPPREQLTPQSSAPIGSDENVQETVSYFRQVVSEAQQRMNVEPEPSPESVRLDLSPEARRSQQENSDRNDTILPFERPDRGGGRSSDDIRSELKQLREMLNVLSAETPGAGLPQEFAPHYRALLDHGVDRKHAAELLHAAGNDGDARILRDPVVFYERLKMEIRKRITTNGGIRLNPDKRRIVALVGPTGVGKTTTLAKLAATFAVKRRAKVGLITTDTYRVAATDQLRIYANIIGIDMVVVNEPKEMTTALRDYREHDIVFIDTAGGSPYNNEQLSELEKLLLVAHPDETLLLMNAGMPLDDMRGVFSQYARLRPSSFVFTKLDETKRYGALYCFAAEANRPVSYLSVGQDVPDDLELANDGLIANLVVEGGDRRGTARAKSS